MRLAPGLLTLLFALSWGGLSHAAELTWLADLEAARERSAAEQKPLLVDFTGSTWCPPCIALDREVLHTPEFAAFAADYILVKLDYPTSRERTPDKVAANPALQQLMRWKEAHAVPGFPTLLVLQPDGTEVARTVGYSRGMGAAAFLRQLRPNQP